MVNFDPASWNRAFISSSSSPHYSCLANSDRICESNPWKRSAIEVVVNIEECYKKKPWFVFVRRRPYVRDSGRHDRLFNVTGRSAPDLFASVWQHPWNSTHHNNAALISKH